MALDVWPVAPAMATAVMPKALRAQPSDSSPEIRGTSLSGVIKTVQALRALLNRASTRHSAAGSLNSSARVMAGQERSFAETHRQCALPTLDTKPLREHRFTVQVHV